MKNYISKEFIDLEKKILKFARKNKNNLLCTNLLLYKLIFLFLKFEKILHNSSPKQKNPINQIKKELENLLKYIKDLNNFKNFSIIEKKFKNSKKNNHNIEINHKLLFNKLWKNFSFKEYVLERIGRYNKRIKLNNISNLIKNKKIVDFGCGHGNFLLSCSKFGANECIGLDYGIDSIKIAKNYKKKIAPKKNVKFFKRSVYKTKLVSNYFDFAIQNGVFHHLNNEVKAYKEVYRVLKKGGYFWVYTCGGGGLKDFTSTLFRKILLEISDEFVQKSLSNLGLNSNKRYYIGDSLSAIYNFSDLITIRKKLNNIGFKYIRQLNGGFDTDFDYPFKKTKWFKKKFGSGDLRLLFKKN